MVYLLILLAVNSCIYFEEVILLGIMSTKILFYNCIRRKAWYYANHRSVSNQKWYWESFRFGRKLIAIFSVAYAHLPCGSCEFCRVFDSRTEGNCRNLNPMVLFSSSLTSISKECKIQWIVLKSDHILRSWQTFSILLHFGFFLILLVVFPTPNKRQSCLLKWNLTASRETTAFMPLAIDGLSTFAKINKYTSTCVSKWFSSRFHGVL